MAEVSPAGSFEASASMIGYMYQIRQALFRAVERYQDGLDWSIAVEAGDDIEEVRDAGRVYYQLKHRAEGTRLTDRSADLWKTLRIWSHEFSGARLDLDETDLLLLTTAEIPDDSAAYYLQPDASGARNEGEALRLLAAAAQETTSKANKSSYAAFNKLSQPDQQHLFARIQIIGNSPNIDAVQELLTKRAVLAAGHKHAKPFLQRLEGWLFQRVVKQLQSLYHSPISGSEFDEAFMNLQNQFRPENLPIDDDIAELSPEVSGHVDKMFVRQLDLIGVGSNRIGIAVRDYLRAFEQRSRWLSDGLLQVGEIHRYERRLTEAWEDEFAAMEDELGTAATEDQKTAAALQIYRWATTAANYRIRNECDEPFVCKGSLHMLADELTIGWHIDFAVRLMTLLEPSGAQQA